MEPSKIKILYVEDDDDTRQAVGTLLQKRGFEMILTRDVKSAIESGLKQEFHILLADIGLADGSGEDVLIELRRTKEFPAIALSAYGMESDLSKPRAAGFDMCITKPFRLKDLENAIEKLLS